jgi:hypothetical protein
MYRGTTPTLKLTIDGISLDLLDKIYVTIEQRGVIELTKTNEDLEIDTENNLIKMRLTEKETFKLHAGNVPMGIQIRATTHDGNAIATTKAMMSIDDVYYEELILEE